MCIKDPGEYFAERLYKSMKGAGTDDETLTRLVVSRSEVDMVEIKEAFFNKYNKSLAKMIKVRLLSWASEKRLLAEQATDTPSFNGQLSADLRFFSFLNRDAG